MLKVLLAELESLRRRVASLEAENECLKKQLTGGTNSRNSSQPPSRDQKSNQPSDKAKKKHGAPFGHQKFSRPLVDNPDQVIQLPVTECEHCHEDLSQVEPEDFERRQITELPVAKPLVIETRQHHKTCPHCLTLNRTPLPEGLEAERYFGPNLEATVIFYKQTQHLSYERIVETMRQSFRAKSFVRMKPARRSKLATGGNGFSSVKTGSITRSCRLAAPPKSKK